MRDGEPVRVRSRRGELTGVTRFTYRMRVGEIFIPFVRLNESAANFLTNAVYDPDSRIPEYKVCAVRVEPQGNGRSARLVTIYWLRNRARSRPSMKCTASSGLTRPTGPLAYMEPRTVPPRPSRNSVG